jgi:hypothetical protein
MIFDGRVLSEITNEDINQLVLGHERETSNLEYKLTVNHKTKDDKFEILCDIASLANAGGGYLVIGIRDDGKGKAQKFETVNNAENIVKSIQSLCIEHISERIEGIEYGIRNIDGKDIIIYRIPESLKVPHMVAYNNNTQFVTRYNDGKREMTIGEIRAHFTDNLLNRRLARIEDGIKSLINANEFEMNQKLVSLLENEQISDLSIEDGNIISKASIKRFIKIAGDIPYFRTSVTPKNAGRNLINVDSPEIKELFENPPNQRSLGWNLNRSHSNTKRFSEGLLREGYEGTLILKQNGFMEFYTKIDQRFCWDQPEEEYKKRPRLYPYPVIEYPLSFFQLYRMLIDTAHIEMSYIITMEYYNIKGFVLPPYRPGTIGYFSHGCEPCQEMNIKVPSVTVDKDFEPDNAVLNLVKYVYNTFGHSEDMIPFFERGTGKFIIE